MCTAPEPWCWLDIKARDSTGKSKLLFFFFVPLAFELRESICDRVLMFSHVTMGAETQLLDKSWILIKTLQELYVEIKP